MTDKIDTGGGAVFEQAVHADRDVVGRDKVHIQIERLIIQSYQEATPLRLDDAALRERRDAYLTYLRELCQPLDFKGIRLPEAVEKTAGLRLHDVYVPVRARSELPEGETWQRIAGRHWQSDDAEEAQVSVLEPRTEPVDLEAFIKGHPALVILGDPGAGKSTLLKYLALALAATDNSVLPILIPLSAYSKARQEDPNLSLSDYVPRYFASRQAKLHDLKPLFIAALSQGKAMVLLDGLDEVVTERERIVALVDDFVREHLPPPDTSGAWLAGNRVVATSRFVGYREAPLTDRRWHTVALVDWEEPEITQFVDRFTLTIESLIAGGQTDETRVKAAQEKQELLNSIATNEGIQQLAGNPLLLTILVLIKRQGVELPERRVELYELYLQTLLRYWNKARSLDKSPVGPDIDYHEVWGILASMALWLRETNPQAGLVTEKQLYDFLMTYYQEEEECSPSESRQKTRDFLASVHRYSSLLLERGQGQFGFIHQTLEEYLAGCGLRLLPQAEAIETILTRLNESHWRETILLGIGVLGILHQDTRGAGALLEALLKASLAEEDRGANVLLAGAALRDVGQVGVGSRADRRIRAALKETLQGADITPRRRREAGLILSDIGWCPENLDSFVVVEPGEFLYGDDRQTQRIEYRYWIAKYPVTNSQFARFVEAGGYREQQWWYEEGWQWLQKAGHAAPRYWTNREYNNAISPVVGVSWYEALAYCNWLHERFSAQGSSVLGENIPEGYKVRLPTEEEWERAARGIDGQEYPWGDEFDAASANTGEEYGGTTAVCCYPSGASPVGAWDMAGNVFEWTLSESERIGIGCCVAAAGTILWIGRAARLASGTTRRTAASLTVVGWLCPWRILFSEC